MEKRLAISATAIVLALAALTGTTRDAQARVSWCMNDLGPMATRADATGNIPDFITAKVVAAPVQAVSTDKGGLNPNK